MDRDKQVEMQQLLSQVDGLNFELLELVDRMNATQLPPIPDIEEVHFSIDKCQVSTTMGPVNVEQSNHINCILI